MKKGGKILLRILAILGILLLCFISAFSFLVFDSTKFLGVIFLCAGLWGILEMGGIIKTGVFREKRSTEVIGTIGAILLGIYLVLR